MSDVNGALNILHKVVGDSPIKAIAGSGRVNRPVRVKQWWTLTKPHPSGWGRSQLFLHLPEKYSI